MGLATFYLVHSFSICSRSCARSLEDVNQEFYLRSLPLSSHLPLLILRLRSYLGDDEHVGCSLVTAATQLTPLATILAAKGPGMPEGHHHNPYFISMIRQHWVWRLPHLCRARRDTGRSHVGGDGSYCRRGSHKAYWSRKPRLHSAAREPRAELADALRVHQLSWRCICSIFCLPRPSRPGAAPWLYHLLGWRELAARRLLRGNCAILHKKFLHLLQHHLRLDQAKVQL